MQKEIKNIASVLYFAALFLAVVMLFLIGINEKSEKYQARADLGYEIIEEYECLEVEDSCTPVGIKKIYTWTLPESIQSDTSLAFYFVHQYVRVYLGDELVCSVFPESGTRIGKTLGCDWVAVPLYQEDAKKQVKVEIIPVYEASVNRTVTFFVGSKLSIYRAQAQKDKWQIILSLASVIIGVVFLGIAVYYMFGRKQNKNLLALGAFSLMLGIWRLTDTWFSPLLFPGKPTLLFYLSVTMLMIGAVPLLKILQAYLYEKEYVLIDICCAFYAVLSILLVGIQMLGLADIRENLIIIHIMILTGVLIAIGLEIYDRIVYKKGKSKGILWICAIGAVLDVAAYYIKGNSIGLFFSLLAFQIYILCTGILSIREYVLWEKKISEQEAELMESRVAIMLSQIQPHFLYNSLTSISYLCGKDPAAAKHAINDFADYLRGNMDSLKQKTPVPFEMELKHVQIYLSLEKMRFEEELQIEYDIKVKEFRIPSLTMQPLVENAVKHGVGKSPDGGKVVISTREKENCYEVIVEDNGVGFDVNKTQEDGKTHIGIANVRSRLWEMSRATLDIVSAEGKGTTATITIPKNKS